jgi:hypothetical protein
MHGVGQNRINAETPCPSFEQLSFVRGRPSKRCQESFVQSTGHRPQVARGRMRQMTPDTVCRDEIFRQTGITQLEPGPRHALGE